MTLYAVPLGPPYAVRDDEFLTRSDVILSEDTADLRDNNNHGNDVYGLAYTGINGVDIVPGEAITLPSGALLTLFEDGTFRYDPNGVVAENGVDEVDTFTYTARPYVDPESVDEQVSQEYFTATVNIIVQAADRPDEAFSGGGDDDEFAGGVGNDLLEGGAGEDKLFGRDGDDVLSGGADDDQLFGGDGNDVLRGGSGTDFLYGGVGDDIYIVEDAADRVIETQSASPFSQNKRFPGLITEAEMFFLLEKQTQAKLDLGADAADELPVLILALNNTPYDRFLTDGGEGGYDIVYSHVSYTAPFYIEKLILLGDADLNASGTDVDDELHGNAGANTLDGRGGQDQMFGSGGNDIYIVNNAADTTVENADEGNDTVQSNISWTLSEHIENLVLEDYPTDSPFLTYALSAVSATGNDLANTITGNSNDNIIDGRGGTDIMIGRTGNDRYYADDSRDRVVEEAGGGDDIVFASADYFLDDHVEILVLEGNAVTGHGNDGDNTIIGNDGDNVLMGHGGTDYMLGGEGEDIFVLTKLAGSDVDVIGDFEGAGAAGGDRIAFSAADFGTDGIVTQVSQTSFIVSRADGSNAQQFIVSNLEAGNGGLSEDDYYFG